MEQITIELPKSVSNELDTYAREHQISSSAIAQKAIEEFLLGQGYLSKPLKPFRLTQQHKEADTLIHLLITMQYWQNIRYYGNPILNNERNYY
jgi:hypothetical protein